jgi:hypothetical protein
MPRLSGTRSGQAIYVLLLVHRNAAPKRLEVLRRPPLRCMQPKEQSVKDSAGASAYTACKAATSKAFRAKPSLRAQWRSPEETVCGMDAASEPPRMGSRRVSEGDTHCKAQQAEFGAKGSRASAGFNAGGVSAKHGTVSAKQGKAVFKARALSG